MLPVVRRQRLHEINIRSLLDGRFLAPCVLFVLFFSHITGSAGHKITQEQIQTFSQIKKTWRRRLNFFRLFCQYCVRRCFFFVCFFFTFTLVAWGRGRDATGQQEYDFNQFSILNVSLCVRLCCCSSDPRLDECIPQTDLLMFFLHSHVHKRAPDRTHLSVRFWPETLVCLFFYNVSL